MFTFLKKLLVGNPAGNHADTSNIQVRQNPTQPAPAPRRTRPVAEPAFTPPKNNGSGAGQGTLRDTRPGAGGVQGVQLLLQSVVNGLSGELAGRVRQQALGNAVISVPLDKVLAQLANGSVKITFGELRRAAPTLFSEQNDKDQSLVALPLAEILAQLNPELLPRRQGQKHIEISDEIRSPFGDTGGQSLVFSVGPGETSPASPARAVTPAPSAAPALPPSSTVPPTRPLAMAPVPVPAPAPIPLPVASVPIPAPVLVAGPSVIAMSPPAVPVSAMPVQPLAAPVGEVATVSLPLAAVSAGWPESLRLEIAQMNLTGVAIALPLEALKASLQRGKAFYPWKTLRGWFAPALAPYPSAHDNTSLELPLNVVAPLFISRQRDLAQAKQKVAIDETIPNLFFGFPQAEAAVPAGTPPVTSPCAVTKPVDTNYYSAGDSQEALSPTGTTIIPAKRGGPTGTEFIGKCATPNEIVSRAAALNGVSGALVALPDGLMVASKLSPDLNGDTLAAFLPQIFGKVNQCTKELRMGELNNLNFTVGNVPWKIFRVNAIFFAAFGRTGQPLPTAELAALAGELDRKKQ